MAKAHAYVGGAPSDLKSNNFNKKIFWFRTKNDLFSKYKGKMGRGNKGIFLDTQIFFGQFLFFL